REMLRPNELTSDWMQASRLAERLTLGDLVEIKRVGVAEIHLYAHWAVYIGSYNDRAYVAHLSTEDSDFFVNVSGSMNPSGSFAAVKTKTARGSQAQVRLDELTRAACGYLCRINNSLDMTRTPFPPCTVVKRALLKLGSSDYNLLLNNCEHFVTYCRYGTKVSEQVEDVAKSVTVGSLAVFLFRSVPFALIVACLEYMLTKLGRGRNVSAAVKQEYPNVEDLTRYVLSNLHE
uniref:LRAT domain-containing protein n=2 Tax=Parascaris univalens TaxID=6257 RepID=A0A914ZG07_PARUN